MECFINLPNKYSKIKLLIIWFKNTNDWGNY